MKLSRLADWLLTTEPSRRLRLSQAALAIAVMGLATVGMHYFVRAGIAPAGPVWAWTACSVVAMAGAFALVRSGWTQRLREPSLSVPQMVVALGLGAWAYALLGPARGAVFPIVMVVVMFGLFAATPGQMAAVAVYAVAVFGAVMALMASRRPAVYPPDVEFGHFLMVALMMPVAALLAARLATLRARMRRQREALREALARIEELATRDALTGLANRRNLEEMLERERQRCVRSGHVFCVAVIDLDGFKALNERHGMRTGDQVLRAFAAEVVQGMRISDRLGRWGGDSFVLMLSDTRLALARGGVERLRERSMALQVGTSEAPIRITVSAGLTEHRAGETVDQTLERARGALREAKSGGRDRMVMA